MALLKFVISSCADSILARDRTVNTFHLDDHGTSTDEEGLANDALDLFQTWYGATREIRCQVYGVGGPPPHFPRAEVVRNQGVAPGSGFPREVALVLSYYGERNLPRTRGRMYLGIATAGRAAQSARPGPGDLTAALDLADGLAGLGGADVDWVTYSPTAQNSEAVQHSWCDDEWDTQRRRGLRATTRQTRTHNE